MPLRHKPKSASEITAPSFATVIPCMLSVGSEANSIRKSLMCFELIPRDSGVARGRRAPEATDGKSGFCGEYGITGSVVLPGVKS